MARTKSWELKAPWMEFYRPVKGPASPPQVQVYNWGPEALGGREITVLSGGPALFVAENPGLFATSSTSEEEGYFYWGCLKEIGPAGVGWSYQRQIRNMGARSGQATVDFIIESTPRDIACRIVTPYFHITAGPEQDIRDVEQLANLEDAGYDVVDAFSELYMDDKEGIAVRRVVRAVINREPILVPGSATYLRA